MPIPNPMSASKPWAFATKSKIQNGRKNVIEEWISIDHHISMRDL